MDYLRVDSESAEIFIEVETQSQLGNIGARQAFLTWRGFLESAALEFGA
jgi:hypothetical protein